MSYLKQHTGSAPSTPAAGSVSYFTNSTNNRLWFIDANGNIAPVGWSRSVYFVEDYGVYPTSNANYSATNNVTNLNTLLQTTAPAGSQIIFGAGLYGFNAALTTLTKDFAFQGIRGQTTISMVSGIGSNNFITLDNTGFYTSFRDIYFNTFAAQTQYVIECQNDASVEISDCFFVGAGANSLGGCVDFTGTQSGDLAIIANTYMAGWTGNAINIASPLDTLQIVDCNLVGNGSTSAYGVFCSNGGAMLMTGCQIIKCNVLMGLVPTVGNTVSAIFCENCFFDQGTANALLVNSTTTGTVYRCRFVGCWFTVSSSGVSPNCIQITSSGTAVHGGFIFDGCNVQNATTGSTGTLNGFSLTDVSDIQISNCEISGWTNGINVTSQAVAPTYLTVTGCTIGASGGIALNTTGILLNSGSNYADINIQNNTFTSNTTNITDNSTVAATGDKIIRNNAGTGVTSWQSRMTASTTVGTTVATNLAGLSFPISQPNTNYIFECVLPGVVISTSSATAVGLAITVPAGASVSGASILGNTSPATSFKNVYFATTTLQTGFITSSGFTGELRVKGVIVGGTATSATGNVQVQINAVGSASTTAATASVLAGAWINAFKVT